MAAPCTAAATPAPSYDVRFMLNLLSESSQFCTRKVYNRSQLLGLRNSNFLSDLSGVMFALEHKALDELGILHQQDPEACKAADSSSDTGRCWRRRKRWGRPSMSRKRCARLSKRGSRAGISARLKAKPNRPALPSILLSNVRSLENKISQIGSNYTKDGEGLQRHRPHRDMA